MGLSAVSLKTVDKGTTRASLLRQPDADLGKVVENRLLTSPNAPAKRHIGMHTILWVLLRYALNHMMSQSSSCRRP